MNASPSLTEQLQRFSAGDRSLAEAVLREVLPKLRQIAVGHLQRERKVAPLSPTELINEIWLRSLHQGGWQIRDREHFYSIAAYAMRQVLVDFARRRLAAIRGSGVAPLSLDQAGNSQVPAITTQEQIVEIGIAMDRLEKQDRIAARIVDLHYFAGFTLEETAAIMGLTLRQVRHRWERTRRWLQRRLSH
jgi:RNA polymerase sigma factor (TIGR02999 family)